MKIKLLLLLCCFSTVSAMQRETVSHEDLSKFAQEKGLDPSKDLPQNKEELTFVYECHDPFMVFISHPSKEWVESYQYVSVIKGGTLIGHLPFRSKSCGCLSIEPGPDTPKILLCLELMRKLKGKK